jgi:hypothetical protein
VYVSLVTCILDGNDIDIDTPRRPAMVLRDEDESPYGQSFGERRYYVTHTRP